MSRRVCETCAWFAAGEYEFGICAYRDGVADVDLAMVLRYDSEDAAMRIRLEDDTCEHWKREEDEDEW